MRKRVHVAIKKNMTGRSVTSIDYSGLLDCSGLINWFPHVEKNIVEEWEFTFTVNWL